MNEIKVLYCEYPGAPDAWTGCRTSWHCGGRTFRKLDKEIESVSNTLEIMNDPHTLKK